MDVFQPDLRQHEIVNAAVVFLFNRGRVNEVVQILVHHLCNEGCEGSLRESSERKQGDIREKKKRGEDY